MQLIGQLIHLRALEPTDVNLLYRWENDSSVWSVSGTLVPFSRFILDEFVTQAHQAIYTTKQLRLMIDIRYEDADGEPSFETNCIGCVDLFDFDPKNKRAGIGILIADKADRGKGYATEALRLIVDYGFDMLDLHQIYSTVRVDNESSVALFKKLGFEVSGLKLDWIFDHGKYHDEYTMQLIRK